MRLILCHRTDAASSLWATQTASSALLSRKLFGSSSEAKGGRRFPRSRNRRPAGLGRLCALRSRAFPTLCSDDDAGPQRRHAPCRRSRNCAPDQTHSSPRRRRSAWPVTAGCRRSRTGRSRPVSESIAGNGNWPPETFGRSPFNERGRLAKHVWRPTSEATSHGYIGPFPTAGNHASPGSAWQAPRSEGPSLPIEPCDGYLISVNDW
jgi:hypothetical protein